ncbi:hypothetical protein RJG79_07520 [Mycoplasmatota bacterium WC44]
MNLLQTFILTLIMMSLNSAAKLTMRDYKNKITVILTGLDTFIFVMLISDKGFAFAITYTAARIVGVSITLFTVNKKKEYIQAITIIVDTEDKYKVLVKDLQRLEYKYFARDIETKNLFNKEVVILSRTKEKSKRIDNIIPKDSFVMINKTNSIEII